ncbi:helix-turn-helix transcriptional regulator [Actinoallomurus iriomotensis]|uniref:LuxR family transcriptional regulator n=1 Tax=Actinoallomurus iriomotensis TaxID=478107 RepID=A0A9W6VPS2_9ACTN|nr:LuxR family transcriptional regulator [Actinoallomurus iriomotensis]GLY75129.1 LuxR family transcriptional regulator [Actinoallomurus iriomotensis]
MDRRLYGTVAAMRDHARITNAGGVSPRAMRVERLVRPYDRDAGSGLDLTGRLYGREPDTAALASALDAVAGGRARLLSLEGAAGAGKSALLARARADARRRGWTVLTGRAAMLEAANDFGVLRQVLAGLPPAPDGRAVPALRTAQDDASPFDVFELVSAHLFDVTAGAPVLITLDDLQWCDTLSLRWLAYLAHRSADLPLALVLASSPREMSEQQFLLDELIASCERRTLHRLTQAHLSRWIADVMGAGADDAFVAECHRVTGGNGALLADLLPALAARSVPPVEESLASIEDIGGAAVSRRVLSWIRRCGPEAPAVAQAVAVLGDDGELVLVAQLAGLDLDAAARAADRLIKMDVLTNTSPLRYVHSLTRAVVHAGISAGLRTSQRLRAARLVRDHYAEPERAAAHLMAVDMSSEPWALETLRAAADAALERGLPEQALGYLRRALAEPMPVSARAELLAGIGATEIGAGVAGAESTLHEALAIATEPSLRVRIGVDLAYVDAVAGRPLKSALEVVDEVCARLPPGRDELAAEAELGVFAAYTASADAGEFLDRRMARLRDRAADDARLTVLAGVVDAWSGARRGRDRAECVRRARSALETIDHQRTWELRLRLPAVSALIDAEEYDLVGDLRGIDGHFGHRQGTAGDATVAACLRGRLAYGRGDLKVARTVLGTALKHPSVAGTDGVARLVSVLTDLGDLDAADRLIREHAPAATTAPTWATAVFAFARASLCLARNQRKEALEGFLETGRGLRALGVDNPAALPWRSRAARCHALLGDGAAARALAAEEVALARRWGSPRALSTALAASGVVSGDPAAALEAVMVLDRTDAELHRAMALVDLGTVELETGAVDRARDHLQDGFALARVINARPVWLRAARYIKRAGGRPDLGRIGGVTALTAQERAAAERAAAGATNRQIADDMVLTQRTVEQYLTSVYRKLGITGRPQLAAALSC